MSIDSIMVVINSHIKLDRNVKDSAINTAVMIVTNFENKTGSFG